MKCINEVVKIISNSDTMENNNFDATMKTENEYHTQMASESNKTILVQVNKDKPDKMKQQFDVLKYEQIIPNWMAFFMKIHNHNCITEKY